MLPPENRLTGAQLHRYISDELYWVLHAPRQTGKTTFLQSWMQEINNSDNYVACYISVERCQGINNPVYTEILTRHLNSGYHDILPPPSAWQWQKPDGSMDMDQLLKEFQKFWRRYADKWEEKADYTEAFPHLLLMAFLQRILNGGGRIETECAAGRGRMYLGIEYENCRYIIEIKLVHHHDGPQTVREEGLEQIRKYRDKFSPSLLGKDREALVPAYLLIFDRRPKTKEKPWDERISWEQDGDVTVLGC
jgi:hypothetical protein